MRYSFIKSLVLTSLLFVSFAASAYAQGNFVYANNDTRGPNTITAFSVASNGALTEISGSPFPTGGLGNGGGFYASNRITACAAGNFLFASNGGSNNISVFTINPATGFLTPVPGSPFITGEFAGSGISLGVTPDNRFLFAGNAGSGFISAFSISPNGALTPVPGSPFFAGFGLDGVKVSPDGRFLSAALVDEDRVAMFSIGSNGVLTPVPGSPFFSPAFGGVTGVDINCASNLLFAAQANFGGTHIDVFSIASDGALALVPGSPFDFFGVGSNSNVGVVSPDDRFLFVSNQDSNSFQGSLTVFNVAGTGSLSLVPGSPFPNPGGSSPAGMATNRAGTFLYAANFNNSVSVFSIASNGALTPAPGSPFSTQVSGGLLSLTAFPAKSCARDFDTCIQDDSNGNIFRFNSTTGNYLFTSCSSGFTLSGIGSVSIKGSTITLQDNQPDRRISAKIDNSLARGTTSVQVVSSGAMFTITDRNTNNNTCACP